MYIGNKHPGARQPADESEQRFQPLPSTKKIKFTARIQASQGVNRTKSNNHQMNVTECSLHNVSFIMFSFHPQITKYVKTPETVAHIQDKRQFMTLAEIGLDVTFSTLRF